MSHAPPASIRYAAIAQIVSGVLNIVFTAWLAWFGVACLCGTLSLPFGSVCGGCGFVSLLLIPLGLLEIGAGGYGLLDPREGATAMRWIAKLELAGLLIGGLPGAVVGLAALRLLDTDEAVVFLDG